MKRCFFLFLFRKQNLLKYCRHQYLKLFWKRLIRVIRRAGKRRTSVFSHRLWIHLKIFFPLCKCWLGCCLYHHFWQLHVCLFLCSPPCHFFFSSSEPSPTWEVLIYYPVSVILPCWSCQGKTVSAKAAVLEAETRSTIIFFSFFLKHVELASVPLTQDDFTFWLFYVLKYSWKRNMHKGAEKLHRH